MWLDRSKRAEISELKKSLEELKIEFNLFVNSVKKSDVYNATGLYHGTTWGRHYQLLTEAKEKGFFKDSSVFVPVSGWSEKAKFKHHFSSQPDNYWYWDAKDSLYIPAIGVDGNFSAGTVVIYENGVLAKITI